MNIVNGSADLRAWPAHAVILAVGTCFVHMEDFAAALVKDGHRLLLAQDGARACEILGGESVDLVLVDGTHDLDALDAIMTANRAAVAVVLTDRASVTVAREAMTLGAHAYLTRPCNVRLLQTMIGSIGVPWEYRECG